MGRIPLRERNKQRVRERILAAASELFRSVGYDQTTMDQIAERAEISRGTLFNYFPTKDALLRPFVKDIFQTRIRPAVTVYLDEQHSTLDALRFLFMNIHKHLLTIPHIDLAFRQEFMRPREVPTDRPRQNPEVTEILLMILRYGQERGEVRTDLSVEKLARYCGVLYISIFFGRVLDPERAAPDYGHDIDELLAFVESGMAAPG